MILGRVLMSGLVSMALFAYGCKGDKIVGAAKDFIAFSEGKGRVVDPISNNSKKFVLRRWQGEQSGTRYRGVVDIEVESALPAKKLRKLLSDAVHSPELMKDASVIKVRAWPGKLEKLAAPMGIAIFARDGHGWDGKGVGFEKIFVFQPTEQQSKEKDIWPLSEAEYLRVLGVESAMKRGKDFDTAQRDVAEFQSVPLEKVASACLHAERITEWYKHRAEISGPKKQASKN